MYSSGNRLLLYSKRIFNQLRQMFRGNLLLEATLCYWQVHEGVLTVQSKAAKSNAKSFILFFCLRDEKASLLTGNHSHFFWLMSVLIVSMCDLNISWGNTHFPCSKWEALLGCPISSQGLTGKLKNTYMAGITIKLLEKFPCAIPRKSCCAPHMYYMHGSFSNCVQERLKIYLYFTQ